MEQIEVQRLKKWGEKFFNECDRDKFIFDFDNEIDNKLSYEENKALLREKIKVLLPNIPRTRAEAEIITTQKHEQLVNNEIQRVEIQAQLEFEKCLNKIANDNTTNLIEEIYFIPKQYTKMVANGFAKGFILFGEAGMGKSYAVMRAFKEAEKSFVYLAGHITPLELYQFLFRNRTANIILDDVNILNNEINLNMLKSCLNDNSRLVCYNTTSPRLQAPNRFIFEGTICLLLNTKPRVDENLRAVESRVLNYELKMTYQEKMKVLFELAKNNYEGLSQEQRLLIVNWIKDNTNEATKNLNLRVLFHLYEMFKFDRENWEKMAKNILINDEVLELILLGVSQQEFTQRTGLCRATYFNYKKSLKV